MEIKENVSPGALLEFWLKKPGLLRPKRRKGRAHKRARTDAKAEAQTDMQTDTDTESKAQSKSKVAVVDQKTETALLKVENVVSRVYNEKRDALELLVQKNADRFVSFLLPLVHSRVDVAPWCGLLRTA